MVSDIDIFEKIIAATILPKSSLLCTIIQKCKSLKETKTFTVKTPEYHFNIYYYPSNERSGLLQNDKTVPFLKLEMYWQDNLSNYELKIFSDKVTYSVSTREDSSDEITSDISYDQIEIEWTNFLSKIGMGI